MKATCNELRRRILEISQRVSAIHIGPAFSCIEMLHSVYETKHPHDRVILSKGHAAIAQYVVLEALGKLDGLDLYCSAEGSLGVHPDRSTPGVEASTGSLGHGLLMAVGMAYAAKLLGNGMKVYCILSDGECGEGSTWEAVQQAVNLRLDNLIALVDFNDFGGLEKISTHQPSLVPLGNRFAAFGWIRHDIEDGHDLAALRDRLSVVGSSGAGHPHVLVCSTVKGKGVSFMENEPIWHYRSPNSEEYFLAMEELADDAS